MLVLTNFGHMSTYETWFVSRDKTYLMMPETVIKAL